MRAVALLFLLLNAVFGLFQLVQAAGAQRRKDTAAEMLWRLRAIQSLCFAILMAVVLLMGKAGVLQ